MDGITARLWDRNLHGLENAQRAVSSKHQEEKRGTGNRVTTRFSNFLVTSIKSHFKPVTLHKLAKLVISIRIVILVGFQVAGFGAIYLGSYLVRFDGTPSRSWWEQAIATLPLILIVKVGLSVAMGNHRGWWRYATFADVVILAESITLSAVILFSIGLIDRDWVFIPRSIILIDWAGTMLAVCGFRGATRMFRERYRPMVKSQAGRRALVVGASESGIALVREVLNQPGLGLKVVGFLDSNWRIQGRTIAGRKVLGAAEDIRRLASRHRIDVALVAASALDADELRDLVSACGEVGVRVQVVPGFDALLTGKFTLRPRDVDIEDLLCREPVRLDGESIGQYVNGRVVVVTGAAGSIGSEICRQVLAFGPARLVLLDHNENGLFFVERELRPLARDVEIVPCVASITDAARLRSSFERHRPAVVFHAAAHKHVPMMEANPGEAVKNNVFGTRTLVDQAILCGAEAFVMISTDKAVNPTSVMGACKRMAEMYVQAKAAESKCRLVTVRFGNVLGSNGSVVPVFKEQIGHGGPVTITHPEMTRYFMTIPEAAQLVLQAGALGKGGEIFVLDMGEPVRIVDLARDLIRLSGLEAGRDVEIAYTGLRPGEKLFEELYDRNEVRLPTPHPKIFRARHRPCLVAPLCEAFTRLADQVNGPAERVIASLRESVPEYRPKRTSAEADGVSEVERPVVPKLAISHAAV